MFFNICAPQLTPGTISQPMSQPASKPASKPDRQTAKFAPQIPPGQILRHLPKHFTKERKEGRAKFIKNNKNSTKFDRIIGKPSRGALPSTRITPFAQHTNHALCPAHKSRPLVSTRIAPFAQHTNHALCPAHESRPLAGTQITPFVQHTNHALCRVHKSRPWFSTRMTPFA